jgi:hypothetical protein
MLSEQEPAFSQLEMPVPLDGVAPNPSLVAQLGETGHDHVLRVEGPVHRPPRLLGRDPARWRRGRRGRSSPRPVRRAIPAGRTPEKIGYPHRGPLAGPHPISFKLVVARPPEASPAPLTPAPGASGPTPAAVVAGARGCRRWTFSAPPQIWFPVGLPGVASHPDFLLVSNTPLCSRSEPTVRGPERERRSHPGTSTRRASPRRFEHGFPSPVDLIRSVATRETGAGTRRSRRGRSRSPNADDEDGT